MQYRYHCKYLKKKRMNVRYYRCLYYFLFLYPPPPSPFQLIKFAARIWNTFRDPSGFFFFSLQTIYYCGLCDVLLSSSGKYLTTIYSGNFTSFTIPSHIYAFSVHAQKSIQIFPLWHGMVTIVFVFGHRVRLQIILWTIGVKIQVFVCSRFVIFITTWY